MNSKLLNDYVELLNKHGQKENANYFRKLIDEARDLHSSGIITPGDDYEIASEKYKKHIRDKDLPPNVGLWDSIQRYGSEIEAVFKFDKINLPFPVFCGVFPTGSFNAEAIRTPNGALLLLNEGLFMLVHRSLPDTFLNEVQQRL